MSTVPAALRPGDTIALVAPAGPVATPLLDAAIPVLESWDIRLRVYDSVRSRHPDFRYLAGTDTQRAQDFQDAWLDPDVAAVFAARGGYGCSRMLDLVDWDALRETPPKLFVGSSDTTALHEAISVHLGLSTVFASMPASTHFDEIAAANLYAAVFAPGDHRVLRGPADPLVPGRARGTLIGGNLSLLTASIGASEHRPATDAIAVLEDVGEEVYRLDRLLTQLLRTGWFDRARGILLGSWADCGEPDEIRTLMRDRLAPLGVPIAWEFGFGHIAGSLVLPLGVDATMDADAGTLTLNGEG